MSLFDGRKHELKDEIESHLRMDVAERMAQGDSRKEARQKAIREFGNVQLVADVTRERCTWLFHAFRRIHKYAQKNVLLAHVV